MTRPFRFAPPPRGRWALLRPRLLHTMARRWELRLLTIEAGAGVGKTTLLAHAMEEHALEPRGRDVWLSLEASDSSTTALATGLLRALGRPADERRQATMADVADAVWDAAPTAVCILLDDVHHVDPASPGAQAIAELVTILPANGHLVLSGRSLPDVPREKLRAEGRLAEIREDDLRFADDEVTGFAQQRGVPAGLLDGIGGWPALAELRAASGAASGAVSDRAYLWEEVLAALPDEDRTSFLLVAAVGGGDVAVVEAATGASPDPTRFARVPLCEHDARGGLRPHALWSGIAHERLDPATLAASRRRVGHVLRGRGDYGTAFELLADAGDWDDALQTLFDACNDQVSPPWPDVVQRWRDRIGPELADRPEVAYLEAYLARSIDPWSDAAMRAFERSIAAFRASGDVRRAVVAEIRMLWSAWLRGEGDVVREADARMFPVLTGRPGSGLLANVAMLADIDGDTALLRQSAERLDGPRLEPRLRHFPGLHRVQADLVDGRAGVETARHAEQAAIAGAAVAPAAGSGWAALAPALVSWACRRLDASLLADLGDPGPRFSIAERAPFLAFASIRSAHLGDLVAAQRHADALAALVPGGPGRDLLAGLLGVVEATLLVARGDEARAGAALRARLGTRELRTNGAGRAVVWFPAVPYLVDERCRAMLDGLGDGPTRGVTLEAVRVLQAWRSGDAVAVPRLVDDPDELLAALPVTTAVELLALAHERRREPLARADLERLVARAPAAVRDALRRLSDDATPAFRKTLAGFMAGLAIPPGHRVRIEVLGPLRLFRDGVEVHDADLGRERVRQVLLALVGHRELRRSRLGVLLWPDHDEAAVSANLRVTLTYVQALLEPDRRRGDEPWFLRQEAGVFRLAGGAQLEVDAWEVDVLLDAAARARADATPSVELDHLLAAVRLWRGEYLDEVAGDEWAEHLRAPFTRRLVPASLRAGELLLAGGRNDEAASVGERVLAAEPWSEPAYRLVARARAAAGDRAGAWRALAACRAMLRDLDAVPEPATVELERLLTDG